MQSFPPTVVLRHRRENLKKCSLSGLEKREDFKFYTYPRAVLPPLDGYILLHLDAPVISVEDRERGLFLLDATWRYASAMYAQLGDVSRFVLRSIPPEWRTAYPRRQADCSDPERGLASIEAIHAAYTLMGRDTSGLLDHYYWKDQFISLNSLQAIDMVHKITYNCPN